MARYKGIRKALEKDPNQSHLYDLEENITKNLEQTLDQEEWYWLMRAWSNWLMLGDMNTLFFHTSTIIKSKMNKVSC